MPNGSLIVVRWIRLRSGAIMFAAQRGDPLIRPGGITLRQSAWRRAERRDRRLDRSIVLSDSTSSFFGPAPLIDRYEYRRASRP
jgi:hypothetical protein